MCVIWNLISVGLCVRVIEVVDFRPLVASLLYVQVLLGAKTPMRGSCPAYVRKVSGPTRGPSMTEIMS